MSLTKTSIKRPLTIVMAFLVLIMFGWIGYTKMSADTMPKMDIPVLSIETVWQGAGPEDIDKQISEKIEEKVSAVSKVKETSTYSQESSSVVVIQFEYGTDINTVINDVKSKVDEVKSELPSDSETPAVIKMDVMNASAIGRLVISGGKSNDDLMKYAEDVVQTKIKTVDGVAEADIVGGEKSQVNITADPAVLSSYNVSLETIKSALQGTNKTFPYGSITQGEDKIVLRGMDELNSLDDIKQIQISTNKGQSVRLDEICNVEYGTVDKKDVYRYNGKESLIIDIKKQQDANTIKVMEGVNEAVAELSKNNSQYNTKLVSDSSEYIKTSVNNVISEIFISSIISFIIILAFLKSIRASFAVALAIPTSIVGTIAFLYFTGETLNMLTLSSLVISVGLVVDNSIVVIENIFKYKNNEALTNEECALQGTKTVTSAITGSTLTIICVFLPILFTDGLTKIIFQSLAKTVIAALAISLIVALTLVPSMFNKLNGGKNSEKMKEKPSPIFDKISEVYMKLINVSLKHKRIVVILSTALFIVAIFGATLLKMEFMSASDNGKISISIDLPEGLALKPSNYYVSMAEEKISDIPEIKTIITTLKTSSNSNSSSINIELVPKEDRKKSTAEIEKEITERMNTVPDCKIKVALLDSSSTGEGSSSDFAMKLKGPDLDTLEVLAKQIEGKFSNIEGFQNIETSIADTSQEAQFIIDKQKANKYGINTSSITSLLNTAVVGDSVTTAKINDYEVDVNLKFKGSSIDNLDDIKQIKVLSKTGEEIPLGEIAHIKMANGLKQINRSDGDYFIDITASLKGVDTGTAITQATAAINELNLPKDYEAITSGDAKDMQESMMGLVYAMGIAVILVYMVMVAEFESFSKPFIIMTCIPFAFVGVVAILLITQIKMSIVGMLGAIMLVGIVVNHGIVLIDYIEQLRKSMEGKATIEEIVSKGSATRLRPVLMTVLTAAFGMLPTALALEEGGEMMQSLGVVIIGGLSVSTLVTLVLIPVIYVIFDKLEKKFANRIHKITGMMSEKIEQFKEGKIKPKFRRFKSDEIEPKAIDKEEKMNSKN
jgi:HAE1 family hydrophobic/amphiphilic exporter-1